MGHGNIHRQSMLAGFLYIVGAAFLWSVVPICAKFALKAIDPYTICWLRLASSAILLYLIARLRGEMNPIVDKDIWFVILGGFGITGNYLFYIKGMQTTTASAANVIIQFEVISLVFLSYIWLKERISIIKIVGMLITFLGVFCAIWNGESFAALVSSTHLIGNTFVLVAAPSWAFYALAQKVLTTRGQASLTSLVYIFSIASLITLPPAVLGYDVHAVITPSVIISMAVLVVLGTVGSYVLLGKGFEHLDASTAGMITCLLPIFTIINARIFLSETISVAVGGGALMVIVGLIIIARAETKKY